MVKTRDLDPSGKMLCFDFTKLAIVHAQLSRIRRSLVQIKALKNYQYGPRKQECTTKLDALKGGFIFIQRSHFHVD